MLTVLETLGPAQLVVFVLREVFGVPYEEISEAVDKSPAAVRQIAHRARDHVSARRPRMAPTRDEQQAAVDSFRAAIETADILGLLQVLAPDVVLVADGGGLVPAVRQPVSGADRVARLLAGFAAQSSDAVVSSMSMNGAPALHIELNGKLDTAIGRTVEDGRITRINAIRNPH